MFTVVDVVPADFDLDNNVALPSRATGKPNYKKQKTSIFSIFLNNFKTLLIDYYFLFFCFFAFLLVNQ